MAQLDDYHYFIGRHWETGSVCNYLAYRGVKAPHTGQPYSEALLMGVSGGIVMGYFSFAYKGYDPHVALLTRNTFDPMDTFLERLGIEQEIYQTSIPEKGRQNLLNALENGLPAITWVDIYSLPYFELPNDDDMYIMYPVIVYGYDTASKTAWIADRAQVPLTVSTDDLDRARARVKKDKFRVLLPGEPNPTKLTSAVTKGIWDTIKLFTDQPPKGSRENFGFAAYRRWGELIVNPKLKNSWASVFPSGRPMIAGLTSAYAGTIQNSEEDGAERGTYASFLEEAAVILDKPALTQPAALFRQSAASWKELGCALLPDEIEPFGTLRALIHRRKHLFLEQGGAAAEEIAQINTQIRQRKEAIAVDFPLDEASLPGFLENLRGHIQKVQGIEMEAVQALQAAMLDGSQS